MDQNSRVSGLMNDIVIYSPYVVSDKFSSCSRLQLYGCMYSPTRRKYSGRNRFEVEEKEERSTRRSEVYFGVFDVPR